MTEQDKGTAGGGAGGNDTPQKKKDKAPPANLVIPPKKPKLTKAERRALQEAQRAAKAGGDGGGGAKQGKKPKQGGSGEGQQPDKSKQQQSKQDKSKSSGGGGAAGGGGESGYGNEGESGGSTTINNKGNSEKTIELFSHLPPYRDPSMVVQTEYQHQQQLHPAVLELGRDFAEGTIRGGNARCRAMLQTFIQVLKDYVPPSTTTDYRTHLDQFVLKPSFTYWTTHCRPHSVSMGNAFTFLKSAVSSLDRDLPYDDGTMDRQDSGGTAGSNDGDAVHDMGDENDTNDDDSACAKRLLLESMEQFMQERLDYADRAIAQHALSKIVRDDVLLTFGYSEVIHVLLETAANELRGRRGPSNKENKTYNSKEKSPFFVWVVDTAPLWEGRRMIEQLQQLNIACGYCTLNALSFVMNQKHVSKVFLGASALMTNGSIFGRAGTAGVALMAQDAHIPVLVCCETYKISNRVPQLESITYNELGNPDSLVLKSSSASATKAIEEVSSSSTLADWKQVPNLKLLNLVYDVTPSDFVSGVVTEVGIIPPSSVAVLLREMNPQDTAFS